MGRPCKGDRPATPAERQARRMGKLKDRAAVGDKLVGQMIELSTKYYALKQAVDDALHHLSGGAEMVENLLNPKSISEQYRVSLEERIAKRNSEASRILHKARTE